MVACVEYQKWNRKVRDDKWEWDGGEKKVAKTVQSWMLKVHFSRSVMRSWFFSCVHPGLFLRCIRFVWHTVLLGQPNIVVEELKCFSFKIDSNAYPHVGVCVRGFEEQFYTRIEFNSNL